MKLFADRNILAVAERFSRHAELHLLDGRAVSRDDILEADALLVRSITTVDEKLLAGTKVRFVGTATSGIDHIDTDYLEAAGIGFAHAKGSNANAVVDYCFSAIAFAVLNHGLALQESRVGIIGAGAVGGLFGNRLQQLGVEVRYCDPLLAAQFPEREFYSLNQALDCDVVSLHVPLTRSGPHATYKMIGTAQLAHLRDRGLLINACRGLVVDEMALKKALAQRSSLHTVFDVWANEPMIDAELAKAVTIATPHIAGYSQQAKLNATEMLARAYEAFFKLPTPSEAQDEVCASAPLVFDFESQSQREWQTQLVSFPIVELSGQFKAEAEAGTAAIAFDSFRKMLLSRQEPSVKWLEISDYSQDQQSTLSTLGFRFA